MRNVNLFNLSLQHSSSRGSFIAYQSYIRHELVASFSAAVHRTLFHSTRNVQKYFSTHDEAVALKHCQFIFDCFFSSCNKCGMFTQNPLFQSPAYNNHTDLNQFQKDKIRELLTLSSKNTGCTITHTHCTLSQLKVMQGNFKNYVYIGILRTQISVILAIDIRI